MKNGKTVDEYGTQNWYKDGKRHRTDGPAVLYTNGTQFWYKEGERHRTDGPAAVRTNGSEAWYINGKPHRTDGPAVVYADGTQHWYINDKKLTEQEILEIQESMEFDKMMRTALEG